MSQSETLIINPHFKGLVNWPSSRAVTVVTGNVGCGEGLRRATDVEYLDAVRHCADECPELAQTLARAVSAAILAIDYQAKGQKVTLLSVEGCIHRVGPMEVTGAEIVEAIWESIVEPCLALPTQAFLSQSCCTVEESRLIVDEALKNQGKAKILCVTHCYHRQRVDWTLQAAIKRAGAVGRVSVIPTVTPETVLHKHAEEGGQFQFLKDVILAAEVTKAQLEAEQNAEVLVRWLYRLSTLGERLTFGKVNIETWLASRRRNQLWTKK